MLASSSPVVIMPLGDSITKGTSTCSEPDTYLNCTGYREYLWHTLADDGHTFDFVGSQGGEFQYLHDFDMDHEGHGGYQANQIRDNVYGVGEDWVNTYQPDVILLHIGTNDISAGQPPAEIVTEVSQTLDRINQYGVDYDKIVTLILARIINRGDNNNQLIQNTTTFNNLLQSMVDGRSDSNMEIFVVDMESALDYPADIDDNVHPNATGYQKMAAVWFDALKNDYFQNNAPLVNDPGDQSDAEGDTIGLQIEASDPDLSDHLSYTASGLPSNLSIDSGSGLIQGLIDYQAAGSSPYSVTVTVADDGNPPLSSQVQFSWTVDNTNRPPEVIDPGDQSNAEAETVSLPIQASDPDGDGLSFSAIGLPTGLDIDSLSGVISGTLSYTASISSPHAITITVSDDYSPSASSGITFTWSITDTNRRPIVADLGDQENVEAELVDLEIQADDPDGDTLSYAASGLPDGLVIDSDTGLIHGRLSSQSAGHHSVQVVVSDGDVSQDVKLDFIWVVFDRYFIPFLSY
ncbi:MAG: putative Ig domain-containing protein [Anaerolineales bacterium]